MKRALCIWLPNGPRPLATEPSDGYAHRAALERLAEWCQRFSPTVGLEEADWPESLLLDITGLAPLFGGEEALAQRVVREFGRRGLAVRVAVADTIGAAWAIAHYEERGRGSGVGGREYFIVPAGKTSAALGPLPIEALRLPPETAELLRELGVERIEQLESLPRRELPSRFGPRLVERLDQATGRAAEVVIAHQPPPEMEASWSLEYPTYRREMIEFLCEQLIGRLARVLEKHREGATQLECQLDCLSGEPARISVGLFRPSASPRHLAELVQMQLERLALSSPVSALRVWVSAAGPLEYRQREIFVSNSKQDAPRQLAGLVDRLTSRLGRPAVARARLLPDAQPDCAYRYEPLVGTKPKRSRKASPVAGSGQRPLRLYARPLPLAVVSVVPDGPPIRFCLDGREHRIARVWGPERIETGWWRNRSARRDYYRVETTPGCRFWLFRRLVDGQWFLHGEFD
ncbi:MAG: Y-family DNA polymerase [Pirellulales bacterium]